MEGEEALRKVISSLNGLAGIAIIRGELSNATSLYNEALALAEEHSDDFRLDPLLNLHINHNLSEILKSASNILEQVSFCGGQLNEIPEEKSSEMSAITACHDHMKNQKVTGDNYFERAVNTDKTTDLNCNVSTDVSKGGKLCDTEPHAPLVSSLESLTDICEAISRKYLSGFYIRLSQAQQEFQKSYMQV